MFSSSDNTSNHSFLRKSIASISKDPERYQIIQETGTLASTIKRSGSKSYTLESKKREQEKQRDVGKISAAEMVDKVNREAMFMYMAMR